MHYWIASALSGRANARSISVATYVSIAMVRYRRFPYTAGLLNSMLFSQNRVVMNSYAKQFIFHDVTISSTVRFDVVLLMISWHSQIHAIVMLCPVFAALTLQSRFWAVW